MSHKKHPEEKHDEAKPDDAVVIHDQSKAEKKAEESAVNAPVVDEKELEGKTNVEGVGQSEIQDSRERHQFVK